MAAAEDTHGEAIEKLNQIQDELIKIKEKEVLEIKQKRNEMRKLLYDKRTNVIESIPDFWKTAFLGHTELHNLLSEEDQKVFKYFSSLEVENHQDVKSGYSITFNFNPNRHFSDTKIVKTFTFNEDGTTKITATPIQWGTGKEIPKRQKKGNKLPASDISFFSWFRDTEQKLDRDGAIVAMIKDYLWPNPLPYFKYFYNLTKKKPKDHVDEDEDEYEDWEDVGKDDDDDDDDDDQEHDDKGEE